MNLTIGHLKDWKSKTYVTTVLDNFQDRKGITLKVVNNKQVIRLYSMKHGRNKITERTRETRELPSRACLSRTVPFLSPCDFHMPVTEATKMSLFCSSFRPLLWHRFCLLLFGLVLLALSLSQEMSPRCLQLAVQKTNGCSVPAGLWAPYKNTFTPACYKHDFCYFCVRVTFFINTN